MTPKKLVQDFLPGCTEGMAEQFLKYFADAGYAVVKTELLSDIDEELSLIVTGEDQPDNVAWLRKQIAAAKEDT